MHLQIKKASGSQFGPAAPLRPARERQHARQNGPARPKAGEPTRTRDFCKRDPELFPNKPAVQHTLLGTIYLSHRLQWRTPDLFLFKREALHLLPLVRKAGEPVGRRRFSLARDPSAAREGRWSRPRPTHTHLGACLSHRWPVAQRPCAPAALVKTAPWRRCCGAWWG
jgi:hypothetical protein